MGTTADFHKWVITELTEIKEGLSTFTLLHTRLKAIEDAKANLKQAD